MIERCKMCGNELQPWSTGKNHCNMCGNVYDINETIATYTTNTASRNKTVSDYLKKMTHEDPTVKLRKIHRLAEIIMAETETDLLYDLAEEIVYLSEEKK